MPRTNARRPRFSGRSIAVPAYLVAILALVLSLGGAATAGALITGKQIKNGTVRSVDIKNNTVSSVDIKNGTIHLKDIHPASRPHAPLPSGMTMHGGGIVSGDAPSDSLYGRGYAPLPFTTTVPLRTSGPDRNLYFGSTSVAYPGESNPGLCSGSAENPTAAKGIMCVYVAGTTTNIGNALSFVFAGSHAGDDGADSNGFYVGSSADGQGEQLLRFVWAYTAP